MTALKFKATVATAMLARLEGLLRELSIDHLRTSYGGGIRLLSAQGFLGRLAMELDP